MTLEGGDRDALLKTVAEEYFRTLERGEPIDRDLFFQKYPAIADELATFFAGVDLLNAAMPGASERPWPAWLRARSRADANAQGAPLLLYAEDFEGASVGGYRILDKLGRGGMGVVYRAQRLQDGAVLALKVLSRGRGASIVELARFRIEAEALACLDHPNIIKIADVGMHVGYPYIAMEFADGGRFPDTYAFRSRLGLEIAFFLRGDLFVFIGDNTTRVAPEPSSGVA